MTTEQSNEEPTTIMAASPQAEGPGNPQSKDDKKETATQNEDGSADSADEPEPSLLQKAWRKWCEFYAVNEFVVLVIIVILLARAYPPLGADYLQPQITSTWIAVIFIFGTSLVVLASSVLNLNCDVMLYVVVIVVVIVVILQLFFQQSWLVWV
jgi:hypothetical protein